MRRSRIDEKNRLIPSLSLNRVGKLSLISVAFLFYRLDKSVSSSSSTLIKLDRLMQSIYQQTSMVKCIFCGLKVIESKKKEKETIDCLK